jgi:hypothetical protein
LYSIPISCTSCRIRGLVTSWKWRFGYPFIDFAPIPNFFGFGPGKFDWAIKTFSFLLRDNNEVRCDMEFIAGARAKKVFDFGRQYSRSALRHVRLHGAVTLRIVQVETVPRFRRRFHGRRARARPPGVDGRQLEDLCARVVTNT